jgi:uncharacterized protein (TIGR03437 family)
MRTQVAFIVASSLIACAARAGTINTTLTVTNATLSFGASTTVSGPATLTNIGSGMFSASVTTNSSGNFTGPFTITLTTGDTITGTVNVPSSVLGGSGTGSATVTGGTGAYVNASGSFPSLAGSSTVAGTNISISLTGSGTIVTGGPPAPVISAVLDAATYTPSVAQGSIFVVKGKNLSASGFSQTSFPLPPSFNGVSITFTPASGGSGTNAPIVYLYNQGGVNQLAAVVPSTLAPGNYNVTVTNGVTGPSFQATVVARKAGIITQDATGNGLAVTQNYVSATDLVVNRYTTGTVGGTTIGPAVPGQTEILWVIGMGAVPGGSDTMASPTYDFTQHSVTVAVNVGGTSITPFYAGRAPGLVGVDQINFTLPANIATGCTQLITITVNGVTSQATTFISIAAGSSANACVEAGFTTSQLQAYDQGAITVVGGFTMTQFAENVPELGGNIKLDNAEGSIIEYTGFELASIPPQSSSSGTAGLPIGSCLVTQPVTSTITNLLLPVGGIALDAGQVTLNGPSGSNLSSTPFTETSNIYSLGIGIEGASMTIPGYGNGKIIAGTYTLAAAGGTGVNAFNTSIALATPLSITGGLPTTIVRANGVSLAWTGGNSTDLVEIFGGTTPSNNTGTVSFVCFTTAGTGGFNVPASITDQLLAVPTSGGSIGVASGTFPSSGSGFFNFTLVSDGSSHQGTWSALVGISGAATYQ